MVKSMHWWKDFASIVQSIGTLLVAVVGGGWALWRFGLRQERYPHIETSADIQFIGEHNGYWIVELIAVIENKGTAQHKMKNLEFDLCALDRTDNLKDA